MLSAGNTDESLKTAGLSEGLGETDSLAVGDDIIGIAMEDKETGRAGRDVSDGADEGHQVGAVGWGTAHKGCLGRLLVFYRLAVLHVGHVDRTKPIDDGVDSALVVEIAAHSALDVEGYAAHGILTDAVGHSRHGRQVTAA